MSGPGAIDRPSDPADLPRCPRCGALNDAGARQCWLCDEPLAPAPAVRPREPPAPGKLRLRPPPPPPPIQVGRNRRIGTLMVVIALIALGLGIAREAPGLALLLAILLAPTLTAALSQRIIRNRQGRPLSAVGTIVLVLATTVLMLSTIIVIGLVSMVIALLLICGTVPFS